MLHTLVYVIAIFTPFVNCRTFLVTTSRQLQDSLRAVNPGDTIQFRDGYYTGNFVASRVGQANAPIRLIGSQRAILSNNGGVGLYVTGQYWWIRGFSIQNTRIGIILYGARNNVIERLTIRNTEEEGIIVQRNSVNNVLRYISVTHTGLRSSDYGYGISIGSDSTAYSDNSYYQNNNNYNNDRNLNPGNNNNRNLNPGYDNNRNLNPGYNNNNNNGYNTGYNGNYNQNGISYVDRSDGNSILYNRFATGSPSEAIHIYEGTCCGNIIGNYFDGRIYSNGGFTTDNNNLNQCWVAVNGNQYRIEANLGRYSGLDGFQVLMISGAYDNNVNDGNIYYSPTNNNDNNNNNNNVKSNLNQASNVQTQQLTRNSDNGYYDDSYNSYVSIAGGCSNVFRRNRCELNNLNGYCIRVINPNRCRITVYSDNSVTRGSVTNVAVTNL